MTVTSDLQEQFFDGNGTDTDFPFAIQVQDISWVKALVDGVEVTFTVIINDDQSASAGGTVTFETPPPAGSSNVTIFRDVPLDQLLDFPSEYSPLPVEAIEDALDKTIMSAQQVRKEVDQVADSYVVSATYSSGVVTFTDQDGVEIQVVVDSSGMTGVYAESPNTFTDVNTFDDFSKFKGTGTLPVSNDFGEVILSSGKVSIMVGDGSNTSNTELASFGPSQGRLKLGGVQIDASSGAYKELNHNADLFYVGKFNSVNTFFSDLADITSYLSSISLAPFISMQCYVADQGMAIYYPPSITGLPANAWVLLHDPTTAIT